MLDAFDPREPIKFTVWSNVVQPTPMLALEGKSHTGVNLIAHVPMSDEQERVVVSG